MSKEKETPESVTLGAGAPGDPARMEAPPAAPVVLEGVAYEKSDISVSPILRVSAILAVVTVLSAAAAFGVFHFLGGYEAKGDPPTPPLSRAARRQFPEPRLQTGPVQDLGTIQEQERRHLGSAGWVDEATGVARIPIDDAISLAAERMGAEQPLPLGPIAAPVPSPMPTAPASPAGPRPTAEPPR